ncbi:MAG: outer membrane protein OmpA-like peptidoglycan-associated protein [Cocleimonas sp.]|jgi:outer membrane protein OmpA-like peptidoglycan-associated protein
MNSVLKISLITSLLIIAFQSAYADDSNKDAVEKLTSKAQYVLPPPSPFFSSNITSLKTQNNNEELAALDSKTIESEEIAATEIIEESSLGSNNLKDRIYELEMALKDNQLQATNLVEELHATAKNADFENEMFEKTVSLLQEKIKILGSENKDLTTKLSSVESTTVKQQGLLSTSKKESTEFNELKNSYVQRKEEVSSLKKQIEYFEVFRKKNHVTNIKVQTLEDAYTVKSNEVEELKASLNDVEASSKSLINKVEEKNIEIASLKEKISSEEQIQAELVDLQNAATESNDSNVLLKAKIVELDDANKSLKSQLGKAQQEASQHTRKLGLIDQSTAELEALKSAYKERNDEAANLKDELIEIDNANKSLLAEIETLKTAASDNIRKLTLFDQSTAELTALKSAYKERNEEAGTFKDFLSASEESNNALLAEIEAMKADATKNSSKLGLLDQSISELTALKGTNKELIDEAQVLKEKIVVLDGANKTLLSKTQQLENDASQNKRKLGLMDQSSAELTALKSAYKERNNEAQALKEKITELDNLNKTFQSKIQELENAASQNMRKLGLMEKSSAELIALKSAYTERNDEAQTLKDNLLKLDNDNKTLFSQLEKMKADTNQQTRKLGLLDQSTAELSALKSAYKDRNNENMELKKKLSTAEKLKNELDALKLTKNKLESDNSELTVKLNEHRTLKSSLDSSTTALSNLQKKLDESENTRKTLSRKIGVLESNTSDQKRKLTTITKELESLKSAYKDLNNENLTISNKFSAAMLDTDKDGVINELDKCPSSTLGSSVDSIGCPEISDADGDKVPDANDLCANTSVGSAVNKFGCEADKSITLEGVNFATGSDRLTINSLSIINTTANALKANPSIEVEVAGHTDGLGIKSVNQTLSKRRANSVAIQLVEQGVNAAKISTRGYGESKPIAPNNTEEGRLKNRRVELKIR